MSDDVHRLVEGRVCSRVGDDIKGWDSAKRSASWTNTVAGFRMNTV